MEETHVLPDFPHSSRWRTGFRQKVVRWYRRHGRDLPWRKTHDPYAIWISEAMLQQTQVATVIDYYNRFLHRFPDVVSLASALEHEVLQLWSGLGYYRRAKQLHLAAKLIVADFEGRFPSEPSQLEKLPGVGRYTAGAISSFAFDRPAPILEANTTRLFSRLIGLSDQTHTKSSQHSLWQFAEWILPRKQGACELNQAVMELGSLVCKPLHPLCNECPLVALCPTFAQGRQHEIPRIMAKQRSTPMRHVAVLVRAQDGDQQRMLMRRCPDGQWWSGMWDFPRVDLTDSISSQVFDDFERTAAEAAEQSLAHLLSMTVQLGECAATLRHSVTRYRIQLKCYFGTLPSHRENLPSNDLRWATCEDARTLPLTSTAKKIWKSHLF